MNRSIAFFAFALSALAAASSSAQGEFTYEGSLKTAQGLPLPSGTYGAAIRIYDAAAGGSLLWSGSTALTVDSDGRFAVSVGDASCAPIQGDAPACTSLVDALRAEGVVRWYVGVSVDGEDEIAPRQELVSVPIASRAMTLSFARGDLSGEKLSAVELTVQGGFSTEGRVVSSGPVESDSGSTAEFLGGLTVSGGDLAVGGGMNVTGATLRVTEAVGFGVVPKGAIVALAPGVEIPDGWVLCDGQNDTPDLTGRFVCGCATDDEKGGAGGEAKHRLTTDEIPPHSHSVKYKLAANCKKGYQWASDDRDDEDNAWGDWGNGECTEDFTSSAWGGNGAHENRPPYRALRYIMKK
ncbi:MAG: hypothetical protein IKE55_04150 [Kiritimatiellae bacterium]|nr:hypothetical protein [Kiritimatiellia bacterium]